MACCVILSKLMMYLIVCTLNSPLATHVPGTHLTQQEEDKAATVDRVKSFSPNCEVKGSARVPAFSRHGHYTIGGVFSIHFYIEKMNYKFSTKPEPSRCTGRSVQRKRLAKYFSMWFNYSLFNICKPLSIYFDRFILLKMSKYTPSIYVDFIYIVTFLLTEFIPVSFPTLMQWSLP